MKRRLNLPDLARGRPMQRFLSGKGAVRRAAALTLAIALLWAAPNCARDENRAADAQTCLAIALICTSFSPEEQARLLPGCIAVQLGNSGACFGN